MKKQVILFFGVSMNVNMPELVEQRIEIEIDYWNTFGTISQDYMKQRPKVGNTCNIPQLN